MKLQQKLWRFEAYNPRRSTEWRCLWHFDDHQLRAHEVLRNELNKINAPVLIRIVRDHD